MHSPAEQCSTRQLCAGLFAALTLPIANICAGYHWLWVLLGAALAGLLYYIVYRLTAGTPEELPALAGKTLGKSGANALLALTAVSFVFLSAGLGAGCARAFRETADFPAAGWAILALGAWAAFGGIRTVLRSSALLFGGLAVIFGVVLGFSVPQAQARFLAPPESPVQLAASAAVFTLPLVALYFRGELEERNTAPAWWVVATALTATLTAAVTAACLSQQIASEGNGFLLLAKSVSVFGVMERFEALVSSAFLAGSFCVVGLFCAAGLKIAQAIFPDGKKSVFAMIFFSAAAVLSLFMGKLNIAWLLGVQGLFCGLLPLVLLIVGVCKKV